MAIASMPNVGTQARDAIAQAVRLHGAKRGLHMVAGLLGIRPDTARKIGAGTVAGTTINPIRAQEARLLLLEQRLAALKHEQHEVEKALAASVVGGISGDVVGGGMPLDGGALVSRSGNRKVRA